jgi:hypothetical protein
MTPELKTACETVFQEHKISNLPVKWTSDTFRGRISIGLCEMAKETLVKKNIILLSGKSKKITTELNPAVAAADSFEEAEKMIINKIPASMNSLVYDPETYIADHVYGYAVPSPRYSHRVVPIDTEPATSIAKVKWYMKPLFYYFLWPLCAAAAGVLVTRLIVVIFTELFWNQK